MIKTKKTSSFSIIIDYILLFLSFLVSGAGIVTLVDWGFFYGNLQWIQITQSSIATICPLFVFSIIARGKRERLEIKTETNILYKCKSDNGQEFILNADSEEEAKIFLETEYPENTFTVEESDMKILGFNMTLPKNS